MKILVAISKTPDTTAKITFTDNNKKFNETGVQWVINPYDECYSLIRAVELKEAAPDTVIHVVTVGDASSDAILRKALAFGGDEAIRINAAPSDSFFVASQIAAIAKDNHYDLIFTGKESIDYNSSAVGAMIAEMLDLPYLSTIIKLDIADNKVKVTSDIDNGEEISEALLPAVISAAKGLAKQRVPNMRGIMAARTKPLKVMEPVAAEPLTETVAYELPPAKTGVKLVEANDMETLIKLLHDEAKVI